MATGPVARINGQLLEDWQHTDGKAHMRLDDSYDVAESVTKVAMLSWDTGTLAWVKFTGGGVGGGGDASAANQTTEIARLDSILAQLNLQAELSETQPVSAASLPLPAGASTSALQTTANTSIAAIDTTLGAQANVAWDGAAASATLIAIQKYIAAKIDAVRVLLAGTLVITGNVGITGTPQVDVSDEDARLLGRVKSLDSAGAVIDPATQATLALIKAKTDNLDVSLSGGGAHVIVDAMPAVSANSAADVLGVDDDAGYSTGDLAKNLTQTDDGRLRVAAAAMVSDTIDSLLPSSVHSLSLTADGRLRVATAAESNNFAPWGDPEQFGTQRAHIRTHPLCAW